MPRNPVANPDPNNGSNWRASAQPLGSPGSDDPDPAIPSVSINEVLTASLSPLMDSIELFDQPGDRLGQDIDGEGLGRGYRPEADWSPLIAGLTLLPLFDYFLQ